LDDTLGGGAAGLTKKERVMISRERDKLEKALGGIKDMGGTPDLIFVIDTNKEQLAIKEAQRLRIPVVAVLDSNSDPDGITFPVPGNDDAGRAISLYCDLAARAAIDGISRAQGSAGFDMGEMEEPSAEALPAADGAVGAVGADERAASDAPAGPRHVLEILTAPRGAPDDLAKLPGVGPQIVKKLNDAGIFHYWQIAAMSPEDAAKIDRMLKLAGRIERDGWIALARSLVAN
jgi:small subunit ribosomal protein S2